ncbi:NfeD family protein [Sulfurovum sp.]|uniref:NfeD family protein n=1 Tax=Sulfurovum sp. TaxID=1969726 RepID=UPI0025D2D867|nr:NfeD family protein [Sulfurovum sp.]
MIEFLTQYIAWWHWIILGILFIIIEMGTGTFITLGFGVAAVIVGLLELLFGMNFLVQVSLWLLLSVAIIAFLFKYFKKQPTVSSSGQSDQGLDTLGTVTKKIEQHGRGKVRFDTPVLGNTVWHASANQTLETGERVKIEAVNGQLIKVAPVSNS